MNERVMEAARAIGDWLVGLIEAMLSAAEEYLIESLGRLLVELKII